MEQDIEKKEEKNVQLDWMYKGPNQMVNREDYLLGKPVDKAFEQMLQAEKDVELNRMPKNHVEYECIPPSLRFFSGNEQVDLARKMQEDPLYAIKKKEMETKNQLLKNPVKLKQLKELVSHKEHYSQSKKKEKKSKHREDSDDEAKLDMLLITKLKQLRSVSKKDFIKLIKKIKQKKKKKSKKRSYSKSSESDSSDTFVKKKRKSKKENRKRKLTSKKHNTDHKRYRKDTHYCKDNERQNDRSRQKDSSRNRYNNERRRSAEKQSVTVNNGHRFKDSREEKWRSKAKPSLTEKEKELRRKEMMANAVWREKEREKALQTYREEEKREAQDSKLYNTDFIRKQLVAATEMDTVASRIKANINNIQRSGCAMDTNFAKR